MRVAPIDGSDRDCVTDMIVMPMGQGDMGRIARSRFEFCRADWIL